MYMLNSVISLAFFAVAALAQTGTIQFTSFPPSVVTAGSAVNLTWIGGDSSAPVTITLKKGLSTDLKDVGVLTSTATGGSYTWVPDSSIANGDGYALYISQGTSQDNYSGQFSVKGGSTAADNTSFSPSTGTLAGSNSSAPASSTHSSALSSASTKAPSTLVNSSTSKNATTTSSLTSNTTVPASGASGLQSPLALLFGFVAAMLYVQ